MYVRIAELITAIITPFDAYGEIDEDAFEQVIEHVISRGSDGIIVAGTTGESPTLSIQEKKRIFKLALHVVDGRIQVIAGTGTYDTKESIALTKTATDIGVDGIMAVTPYYNRPSQKGLYAHFKAISMATDLPIMLYHIPSRASVYLEPETIVRLSQITNIRSLKDAAGNIGDTTKIIKQTDSDFKIYSGDDAMTLPLMAVGSNGVVSVASHVIGNEMKEMMHTFLQGDVQRASSMHTHLSSVMNGLFTTASPTLVKEMLEQIGLCQSNVRLPLVQANETEKAAIQQLIKRYNIGL